MFGFKISRFCPICGAPVVGNHPFCGHCEQKLWSMSPAKLAARQFPEFSTESLFLWEFASPLSLIKLTRVMKSAPGDDWRLFANWFCSKAKIPREAVFVPAPARQLGARDHAYKFASALSEITGFELRNCLRRMNLREQKKLSKWERQFRRVELIETPLDWSDYKNVIIVDDVVTTGSTAKACIQALGQPVRAQVWALIDRAPCGASRPLI